MKKVIIILAFVLLTTSSIAKEFSKSKLDKIISTFEKKNSKSAVVILNSKSAEIKYIYNSHYAVERQFPPGSIAKVWTSAVLLENAGQFNFSPSVYNECQGRFYIPENITLTRSDFSVFNLQLDENKAYFRCSINTGHKFVSFHKGICESCNVYFLTWASARPHILYRKIHGLWHLNERTGVRIKKLKEIPDRSIRKITPFQAAASAIGEGGNIRVSPLKVAQTFAALIEGTPLLIPFKKPYRGIRMQYPLNISKQSRDRIYTALAETVNWGTLKGLATYNRKIKILAGKTGTGTHFRKKYITHAWNVIYFKNGKERYVMVTFLFKGRGGVDAKELSQRVLNVL